MEDRGWRIDECGEKVIKRATGDQEGRFVEYLRISGSCQLIKSVKVNERPRMIACVVVSTWHAEPPPPAPPLRRGGASTTQPLSTTATIAVGLPPPSSLGGLRCSRCDGGSDGCGGGGREGDREGNR